MVLRVLGIRKIILVVGRDRKMVRAFFCHFDITLPVSWNCRDGHILFCFCIVLRFILQVVVVVSIIMVADDIVRFFCFMARCFFHICKLATRECASLDILSDSLFYCIFEQLLSRRCVWLLFFLEKIYFDAVKT